MEQRTLANWLYDASAIFVAVVLAELVVLLLQHRMGGFSSLLAAAGTSPTPEAEYQSDIKVGV